MGLEDILIKLGIGNAEELAQRQQIVAEGISKYLDNHPVLSTAHLRQVIRGLAEKEVIPEIEYTTDIFKYYTYNPDLQLKVQEGELKNDLLRDIIISIIGGKNSQEIGITFNSKPKNAYSSVHIFYKDTRLMRQYIRDRISKKPVKVIYSFNMADL